MKSKFISRYEIIAKYLRQVENTINTKNINALPNTLYITKEDYDKEQKEYEQLINLLKTDVASVLDLNQKYKAEIERLKIKIMKRTTQGLKELRATPIENCKKCGYPKFRDHTCSITQRVDVTKLYDGKLKCVK